VKTPFWLRADVLLAVHERLLAEHGGSSGMRDQSLLESAMGKPQNIFAYGKPSLFDLAAAYAFGIVKNHPFIDGNKRAGFMAAYLFLEINGFEFTAGESDVVLKTFALAASKISERDYAVWLKQNSSKQKN
jgi:death-on-curing protein